MSTIIDNSAKRVARDEVRSKPIGDDAVDDEEGVTGRRVKN